jgi:hypothetical protein
LLLGQLADQRCRDNLRTADDKASTAQTSANAALISAAADEAVASSDICQCCADALKLILPKPAAASQPSDELHRGRLLRRPQARKYCCPNLCQCCADICIINPTKTADDKDYQPINDICRDGKAIAAEICCCG